VTTNNGMADKYRQLGLVSDEGEIAVLAGMLNDDDVAQRFTSTMTPEHFHDPRRRIVYEAIASLTNRAEVISIDSVVSESKRVAAEQKSKVTGITPELLGSFTENKARMNELAHRLGKLVWLRQGVDYNYWFAQQLQMNPDIDALHAEAQARLLKFSPRQQSSGFTYAWDTIPAHIAQIAQRKEENKAGVAAFDWPWASWNKMVRPLRPGMLGLLAAPDGMGKSAYLEMIAEHWAQRQHHTVLVHLEDTPDYKYDRRLARFSNVPFDNIEDGNTTPEQDKMIDEAYYAIEPWAALHLHYYHAPGKSVTEIVRELELRQSEGLCDCVVLDYLDKLSTDKRQAGLWRGDGATWERQADNMEILKIFAEGDANRAAVPVFSATQGNKQMQDSGTRTRKDIQGSGQKSQKSQLVVILSREIVGDAGLQSPDGKVIATPGEYSPVVDVRIDKQNRGKTGQFKQWIVGSRFKIVDMASTRHDLN
jgi:replicative DNA helicase